MEETFNFLKNRVKVNFVATVNGDEPNLRPFGDPVLYDDKIYVITSKRKNVSKELAVNNRVCIVAYDGVEWIRIRCRLVDDSDNIEAKKAMIKEFDWMKEVGYTLDNPDFQILYIVDAEATISNEDGEIISVEKF